MCKALTAVQKAFSESICTCISKVLFLLSGKPTDGDPIDEDPCQLLIAELPNSGVTIVTCFLTSDTRNNPKRLIDEADDEWGPMDKDRRRLLFNMSSIKENTDTELLYLSAANWSWQKSLVSCL